MAEYTLAPKYVLAPKEEVAVAINDLTITLVWHAPIDLDLMIFYRKKDGTEGSVRTPFIKNGSLGSLTSFPFIELSGDEGVGGAPGAKSEEIHVSQIHPDMAELHIFAVNYTDAFKGNTSATFGDYDGLITVVDKAGTHNFNVPLASTETGFFAHTATICNTGTHPTLKRVDRVLGMVDEFFGNIPGAKELLA
jgi:uncharacterized protein involved in tellurium resistance